ADTHEPDLAPAGDVPDGEEVQVPVRYDGPDVDDVARLLGCSRQALTDAHHAQEWTVAMVGFAPGFGYLVPDGPSLLDWSSLPRRSSPRKQVPVGSVAIAAGMSGIYPTVMPGGWHLIGRTDVPMFDPADESRPALLRPGDRVRFVVEP
ncbi:MAG: 5-oxoprolinase subunit B family protein, partial [Actinomycetes bacterium]